MVSGTIRNHSLILRITVNLSLFHFHEKVHIPRNSDRPYYRFNMLLYVITCNKTDNYVTSYALIKCVRVKKMTSFLLKEEILNISILKVTQYIY